MTAEARAQGYADLAIIRAAIEADPSRQFALTANADVVLHEQMATSGMPGDVVAALPGAELIHDADAWGTAAYAAAWQNTRTVFAARGIALAEDPAAPCTAGRAGALCLFKIQRAA